MMKGIMLWASNTPDTIISAMGSRRTAVQVQSENQDCIDGVTRLQRANDVAGDTARKVPAGVGNDAGKTAFSRIVRRSFLDEILDLALALRAVGRIPASGKDGPSDFHRFHPLSVVEPIVSAIG